ncbi:YbaN family protein [Tissierella carlieri]|uniref:YbaN family protein n=1 Tax=Tissierella carlieri TaxID=689904 RepID=A0ABT1SDQ9_9FIRM|nr:YbaN family protein [Tissierella carlieri]MBU5311324.1 YbaN family protein [Tissierella carlieri]MCQ4924618.1 YbaN family protein [Tissierella carlieri]
MKLYNLIFITLGIISMVIGMIGVIIPVLPTTPFLILASMFFVKGSEKFDLWLKSTKLYKDYAEDFIRDRSMTLKRKITIMLISDLMLLFPLIIIGKLFIKLFIILIAIFKYYYFIFEIKTKKE